MAIVVGNVGQMGKCCLARTCCSLMVFAVCCRSIALVDAFVRWELWRLSKVMKERRRIGIMGIGLACQSLNYSLLLPLRFQVRG